MRGKPMIVLSAEPAVAIAVAHQEIARSENLLGDVRKSLAERNGRGAAPVEVGKASQ